MIRTNNNLMFIFQVVRTQMQHGHEKISRGVSSGIQEQLLVIKKD